MGRRELTYGASGLPSGLTVNTTTGLISGTPTAAGIFHSMVGASDTTGASASASFLWRCLNDAAQQWAFTPNGTLQHAGKCLDDTGYSTRNGTQVQIWTCTGQANQRWAKP
jgi:hypothetical protein